MAQIGANKGNSWIFAGFPNWNCGENDFINCFTSRFFIRKAIINPVWQFNVLGHINTSTKASPHKYSN